MRGDHTETLIDEQLVVRVASQLYAQMTGTDRALPEDICREIAWEALERAEVFARVLEERCSRSEARRAASA